ncbi:MAG: HAD-IB family phosphatase [Nitrospinae bacterium]|nr:HAD-IB family phosphatase [Nitrospinota bacterium]
MKKVFITDFDGTMTRNEFYQLVLTDVLKAQVNQDDEWERYLKGEITHFEVLSYYFSLINIPEEKLIKLLEKMEFHPDTPHWIRELEKAGWHIVVASAGCDWYVRKILLQNGLKLELHTNHGIYSEKGGLHLTKPYDSPFYDENVGISKEKITQHYLCQCEEVVYAGDGKPDLNALLQIKPENRFARGWVATELTKMKEPFTSFDSWNDCAQSLLSRKTA